MASIDSDPTLPFDVLHLIVQEAAQMQDNPTLKQCSLVCSAFRAWSQPALFSSGPTPHYLWSLTKTIGTAPQIGPYVTSLVLALKFTNLRDLALPAVLSSLTNARTLAIHDLPGGDDFRFYTALIFSLQTHIFSSMTHLELHCITFPFSILTCPKLESLTLASVSSDPEDIVWQERPPLPYLRSLTLDYYAAEDFEPNTSLMKFLSRADSLESLVFGHVDESYSYNALKPLVSRYNHSLKVLDVGRCFCLSIHPHHVHVLTVNAAYDSPEFQNLQLTEFESLHTFQCSVLGRSDQLLKSIGWLSKELEPLPPSHPLRFLIFDCQSPPEVHPMAWSRLDNVLHTKQHVQMTINSRKKIDIDVHHHALSMAFQRSYQAGLVSFGVLS